VLSRKKKKVAPRAMLERMESVPCGAKQRGLSGLGTIWASAGITHVNSDENFVPNICCGPTKWNITSAQPTAKHPVVLPIGKEVEFKIKGDKCGEIPDGDKKNPHLSRRSHESDDPDTSAQTHQGRRSEKP